MEHFKREELTFDVWDLGPVDGEVVVLLHGHPRTKAAWSQVASSLAGAGYSVLAPDQRGYSPARLFASPGGRRRRWSTC
jgi:pimeloyl-ACP methyl ester carboxylesterase